jgi:hypothetical protein
MSPSSPARPELVEALDHAGLPPWFAGFGQGLDTTAAMDSPDFDRVIELSQQTG